jgi:hypothetical protein
VWKGPAWLTVLRDLVCLALGVWGVVHEELSAHPSVEVMGFCGVLMVAPGVLAAWLLGRTGSPSLPPPSPPASPLPSSPSAGGGEG